MRRWTHPWSDVDWHTKLVDIAIGVILWVIFVAALWVGLRPIDTNDLVCQVEEGKKYACAEEVR